MWFQVKQLKEDVKILNYPKKLRIWPAWWPKQGGKHVLKLIM